MDAFVAFEKYIFLTLSCLCKFVMLYVSFLFQNRCEQTKQDLVELQTKFKTLQKEKDDCVLQNK